MLEEIYHFLRSFGDHIVNGRYLKRKGYQIEKEISDGNFSRVLVVGKQDTDEKRIIKYPHPKIVLDGLDIGNGSIEILLSSRIKHIEDEIEALDKVKGIDGIAQKIGAFELPFHWAYSVDNLLRYDLLQWFSLSEPIEAVSFTISDLTEFITYQRIPVIVKEYIKGRSMKYGDKITGEENQRVLINAVKALHGQGILWNDPHPKNIVLTSSGKPYIIDLGYVSINPPDFEEWSRRNIRTIEKEFF